MATLVLIEGQHRVVVFNPNGVTGDSPGQRPGFGIKYEPQALKGRNRATLCTRRDDIRVGRTCGIAPFQGSGFLWVLLSQGVALGYRIMPRWGGRPVPR